MPHASGSDAEKLISELSELYLQTVPSRSAPRLTAQLRPKRLADEQKGGENRRFPLYRVMKMVPSDTSNPIMPWILCRRVAAPKIPA
jgi:hypothetical protein